MRKIRFQNLAGKAPPINHASQTPLPNLIRQWVHIISDGVGCRGCSKDEATTGQQRIQDILRAPPRPCEAPAFHEEEIARLAEVTQFCREAGSVVKLSVQETGEFEKTAPQCASISS